MFFRCAPKHPQSAALGAKPVQKLSLIFLALMISACSSFTSVKVDGENYNVRIWDDIPKEEVETALREVYDDFELLKNADFIPPDASFDEIYSAYKGFTPGVPEGIHLKCKFVLNFDRGGMGYTLCVGLNEDDTARVYKVYDSTFWVM